MPPAPLAGGPWNLKTRSIGKSAFKGRIEASEADRTELARALGLIACDRLTVDYQLKPSGKDRFLASGRIEADLVQACVVTLEPVPEAIREEFSVAFWPAEELGDDLPEGEIQLDAEVPEPIEHGEIALGRLVYELISVAMDPFPRSPGADAAEAELLRDQPKPENPFAALKNLKKST
jgi:uncharacterized metal-binding protein YceD (DUF177 family)